MMGESVDCVGGDFQNHMAYNEHLAGDKREEAEHQEEEQKRIYEEVFGYSVDSDLPSNHYE